MAIRGVNARRPVWSLRYNIGTGNITTGAWTQILASVPYGVSALEIFNGSGSIIKISNGTPGNEVAGLIPYTILPGGSVAVVPFDTSTDKASSLGPIIPGPRKGLPLTCQAQDVNATTGYLVLNAFQ